LLFNASYNEQVFSLKSGKKKLAQIRLVVFEKKKRKKRTFNSEK